MHYTAAVNPCPDAAIALMILPLAGVGLLVAWRSSARLILLATCGLICGIVAALWNSVTEHVAALFYLQHVSIYTLLGLAFGRTLAKPHTPLCTQMAPYLHDKMTDRIVRYTRQVTFGWTIYFFSVAAISTLLYLLVSFEAWSIFANLLGAPLIATMFLIEFAVRCHVLPPAERGNMANTWRAWVRHNAKRNPST